MRAQVSVSIVPALAVPVSGVRFQGRIEELTPEH